MRGWKHLQLRGHFAARFGQAAIHCSWPSDGMACQVPASVQPCHLESAIGASDARIQFMYNVRRAFVLATRVLHAGEKSVGMLVPGVGKTAKADVGAYARSEHGGEPGGVYDVCAERRSR